MDAGHIPPTYPFHIAKAYGTVRPPAGQARTTQPGQTQPGLDTVNISGRSANLQKLVAAKVSVPTNFTPSAPVSDGAAFPMYRHPADKNAAATGVSVGRSLDVNG
jgi:hypothetical protein